MYLVTGAAGFIGSMFVRELNQRGHNNILIVDRLESDQKWKNLLDLDYVDFIHADELFSEELITNLPHLPHAFPVGLKAIIHIGACSSTMETNGDFLLENNIRMSQKLFHWAARLQIPFLYASSAATYGNGEMGYNDDPALIKSLRPLNPYGFSKHRFDLWAMSMQERQNHSAPPCWFGLKYFNVYGPCEAHKGTMRSVVKQAYEQITEKGSVSLFQSYKEGIGDGEQKRDFIYVKDITKAMAQLLEGAMAEKFTSKHSGVYNLGTGVARSFNDLARATFAAMERPAKISYIPMSAQLQGQYQYFTQAHMERFLKLLPGFSFTSLENGAKDYVQYLTDCDQLKS